ncbi:hypothetical protein JHK82_029783 [Glycine max]|nr:hypothetical protein JHK85_030395 [Glycine max]KAG5123046.1 hypothetical protein JHK82_029783 [Glycine max]KAG5144460.1 hypothetical protein JHK84_030003 [Glycine max]
MGCICSKSSSDDKEKVDEYEKEKEKESSNKSSSVQVVAPAVSTAQLDGSTNGSGPRMAKSSSQVIREFVKDNKSNKNHLDAATRSQHQRCNTMSGGVGERKPLMSRILSVQHFAGEQHVDSGWPLWLSSVAAEAIKGWMPRRADSFEKLDQFFTTNPLPCNPSSLPKFSPTKEFDSKRREKEATRKNAESIKGRGPASVYRGAADTKVMGSPKYIARGDISMRGKSNTRMSHVKHQSEEDGGSNDNGEATMISLHNAYTQMQSSMAGPSSLRKNSELPTHHAAAEFSTSSVKKEPGMSVREPGVGYMPKKNRIHCSGPLGGNIDDMLKEHERLMQDVFRSAVEMEQRLANTWRMPLNDKKFIETALLSDLRLDGRRPSDYRKLTVKLAKQDGSAEVHLGQTHVMTFVTAQLVRPYRDRPNEGSLSIFTEFSPMADPSFDPGRPSDAAVELGRVVDRGLRESRAIDTESLCVLSGKLVWAIRVDIHILDNAGNLVDAANIAALASLLTFRRPECSLAGEDGQDVVVHPPEERDPIPLIIHHLPIAVTFGFFSNENLLVIDPTHHEECVMTGRMTATLNSNGDVCAIQKPGGESVSHSVIMHCLKLAHVKATDITTKIRDAVEIHNNERALRKIKRHSSSVAVDVCGEKQNQLDASHLDKLKLEEEEESPMECEASPSGQEQSKDGVSKNFTGGPSSWDPYSECVNSDLLKASLASRGPSVPSKQKDSRRETKPKEPPLEIKTDSTPINKALTAGQNNKGKTLKDAVKPKHKKKKISATTQHGAIYAFGEND